MLTVKKYFPVRDNFFYAPLVNETLRADFLSSEYKLDDPALLTALMLRDGKTLDDISEVMMLPRPVTENILSELKTLGLVDEQNLSPLLQKILELSDCINAFNVAPPPIFSEPLTRSPMILPPSVTLGKIFDSINCAAFVKNRGQISLADFVRVSDFVKNFLSGHGAKELADEVKVLRFGQRAEIFFAARELRFLPIAGENDFGVEVNFDSERTINAEIPVRKFKTEFGSFGVELLFGTILEDFGEPDTAEMLLSFKPRFEFFGDEATEKISARFGDEFVDEGFTYVKIAVAQEVAGDFLCV